MKTTPKKDKRLEIRISEEDFKYLKIASFTIGQTPSEMIRMFITTTVNSLKIKVNQGVIKIEDFETLFNDKL